MANADPLVELDAQFSAENGTPTPWDVAREALQGAEIYWLTTVRKDGRPHVTPLVAVWLDGALYFCTGEGEQKAKNIEDNAHCVLTTGRNAFLEGLDVIVEGDAVAVTDETLLRRLADMWIAKYDWRFDVVDGAFRHEEGPGRVPVFEVAPMRVFAYDRGVRQSATRYRFEGK